MHKTFARLMIFAVGMLISIFACGEDSILYWCVEGPASIEGDLNPGPVIKGVNGAPDTSIANLPGVSDAGGAFVRFALLNSDGSHFVDGNGDAVYLGVWDNLGERESADDYAYVPDYDGNWETHQPMYADLTGYSGNDPSYKFAIEIGLFSGDDWIILAASEQKTYQDIIKHITHDERDAPEHGPWTGGQYAVPEPTSGMLILIGGALLALRRRRK